MYALPSNSPVEMRLISDAEISMVNSRDSDTFYPYLGLFSIEHRDSLDAQCLISEGQIAAYGLAGMANREGKRIAEVGMIHVSPEVRGLGLGSLMGLILRERLLSRQPDELETKVGDDSGKVEHLVRLLGYDYRGVSEGAGKHPIWARSFKSDEQRQAFGTVLNIEIDKRLRSLNTKSESLLLKSRSLDKDNPLTTDIEETVNKRLKLLDTSNPNSGITYFGHVGAPVRIARSVANGDFGYSSMLDLKGVTPDQASGLLKKTEEHFKISTLGGHRQGDRPTLRVSTPLTHDTYQLYSQTKQLAAIAARLYS